MSEGPNRGQQDVLQAIRQCATGATAIYGLTPLYSDPDGPYAACLIEVLSGVFHLVSDLSMTGMRLQRDANEPDFDFGREPLTFAEAHESLADFLPRLHEAVSSAGGPYPFSWIHGRSTTFALLLQRGREPPS